MKNENLELKRIYHNHNLWEDAKTKMYENPINKMEESARVILFFKNESIVKESMLYVVNNWLYSCEHNLTNPSVNKIAYLGQSAVAYKLNICAESTKFAWNFLDQITQNIANQIAKEVLIYWLEKQKEKVIENA